MKYTITIIGDGTPSDAIAMAQATVSSVKAAGHTLSRATVSVDGDGMTDLLAAPNE